MGKEANAASTTVTATVQKGRRTPWFRRIAIGVLVLLLVTVAVHAIWSTVERSALQRQIAFYRAAGEPGLVTDLNSPKIPDEQNAALDLAAAADAYAASVTVADATWDPDLDFPLTEKEIAALTAAMKEGEGILRFVKLASGKPGANWEQLIGPRTFPPSIDQLTPERRLAMFLRDIALLRHHDGRDDLMLENVRELFAIGRALNQQKGLLPYLVSLGMSGMGRDILAKCAPDLRVGDENGCVSPDALRKMIDELLDDRQVNADARQTALAERVTAMDLCQRFADEKYYPAPGATSKVPTGAERVIVYVTKPTALRDGRICGDYITLIWKSLSECPDWPAFDAAVPDDPPEFHQHPMLHMLGGATTGGQKNWVTQYFRGLAERRLLAAVLSMRIYRTNDATRALRTLAELVPNYLPKVPTDPFSSDGRPILFQSNETSSVVYSVGPNGRGEGGIEPPTNPSSSWRTKGDIIMYVDRQPRKPPQTNDD